MPRTTSSTLQGTMPSPHAASYHVPVKCTLAAQDNVRLYACPYRRRAIFRGAYVTAEW